MPRHPRRWRGSTRHSAKARCTNVIGQWSVHAFAGIRGNLQDGWSETKTEQELRISFRASGAKLAKLRYRLLRPTDRYWIVEVELLTGRHHQIRCQLADIGCPIKGDLKYGAPRSNKDGGIISLYAKRVEFVHPSAVERVIVEVPTRLMIPPRTFIGLTGACVAAILVLGGVDYN